MTDADTDKPDDAGLYSMPSGTTADIDLPCVLYYAYKDCSLTTTSATTFVTSPTALGCWPKMYIDHVIAHHPLAVLDVSPHLAVCHSV